MAEDDKYIARKLWIKDIREGSWQGESLSVKQLNVFRVNLVATVVQKFSSEDGQYVFLVLDDTSETIRVKAWRRDVSKLREISEGDIVNIFGGVQEYQGEVYLSPIIIRKMENPNWELLRVAELSRKAAAPVENEKPKPSVDFKELIKKLDAGMGASLDDLIKVSGMTRDEVVSRLRILMNDGEVYEPEPKRLKVLE